MASEERKRNPAAGLLKRVSERLSELRSGPNDDPVEFLGDELGKGRITEPEYNLILFILDYRHPSCGRSDTHVTKEFIQEKFGDTSCLESLVERGYITRVEQTDQGVVLYHCTPQAY